MNRKQLVFPWRQVVAMVGALAAPCVGGRTDAPTAAAPEPAAAPLNFDEQYAQAVAKNPAGASLQLRLKTGAGVFQPREAVSLDLVFHTRESEKYQLDSVLAGFSGQSRRLDEYHIDGPDNGSRYTPAIGRIDRSSGSSPQRVEQNKDIVLPVYLNDWALFDKPGSYRVYVTSARFWPARLPAPEPAINDVRVTSNIVEFQVTPADAAWAEAQARLLAASMDAPGEPQAAQRLVACRELGFLDTETSITELVRRYDSRDRECDEAIRYALARTRRPAFAVPLMETEMARPGKAVTPLFLQTLSGLGDTVTRPSSPAPYAPGMSSTERQRLSVLRRARSRAVGAAYLEDLAVAVTQKRGRARALSLYTLLHGLYPQIYLWDMDGPETKLSPRLARWRHTVLPAIVESWPDLPFQERWQVMSVHWQHLREGVPPKALLPLLREMYQPSKTVDYNRNPWLNDFVLRRIQELAPAEGRSLIFAEIRGLQPRSSLAVLSSLPDKTLPELDEFLAAGLQTGASSPRAIDEIAQNLVARYASPAIEAKVKAFYDYRNGRFERALPIPIIAYFLRVDPRLGMAEVIRAMADKKYNYLYRDLLQDLARLGMTRPLEQFTISVLNGETLVPWPASEAARALSAHGSPAAEDALWRRLEAFNVRWAGRAKELEEGFDWQHPNPDAQWERTLVRLLVTSPRWLTDRKDLERLKSLCVTKAALDETERGLQTWSTPMAIRFQTGQYTAYHTRARSFGLHSSDSWLLGQYYCSSLDALKARIAMFPRGTAFTFPSNVFTYPSEEKSLFEELRAFTKSHGMTLRREAPAVTAPVKAL